MLKHARETVRAIAEAVAPLNLADATKAAEIRRQELTDAQQAVAKAEEALQAAHDVSAADGELRKAEAVLADTRLTADRAQLAYAAAERRLNAAREAEADKAKVAAIVKRDAALAEFTKSAAELDRLAAAMAEHVQVIDAQYAVYSEAKRDRVAGAYLPVTGATLAALAVERAVAAAAGQYTDNKPSASEAGARVTGAVMAVAA